MPTESSQLGTSCSDLSRCARHDAAAFNRLAAEPPSAHETTPAISGFAVLEATHTVLASSAPGATHAESPSAAGKETEGATDTVRRLVAEAQGLSNDQLASQVVQLNRQQRRLDAELLVYLGELDCRKLYRDLACSSMFDYLTARLGQSEDVAYRWMWGARLVRAFPLVHELLTNGGLHLSSLMLLKPHLTEDNHREWLLAAAGKSKREVERMVAARLPKADVPARVRRLPEAASKDTGSEEQAYTSNSPSEDVPSITVAPALTATPSLIDTSGQIATLSQPELPSVPENPSERPTARPDLPSRAAKVQPLSEHSYRVIFTASDRLKQKLDRASELLSHTIAPADLPALLERALDLLLEREERRRYGSLRRGATSASKPESKSGSIVESPSKSSPGDAVSRPITDAQPDADNPKSALVSVTKTETTADTPDDVTHLGYLPAEVPHSRYLPAEVRRQVWERDGGQCSYVDREGRRCQCRNYLEFDHRVAHALGGAPTLENARLRCRAHNALAAEQVFGLDRIADAISAARQRRHRPGAENRTGDGASRDEE